MKNKIAEMSKLTGYSYSDTERLWEKYSKLRAFKANENVFETGQTIDEETHLFMRRFAEAKLKEVFDILLIEEDDNTAETSKRIAKVWAGDSLDCDTELGGGRFAKPVRLPKFPNEHKRRSWIEKKVEIIATCSHHFIPFTGYAIIRYRPQDFVLGISKLQRLANYVGNRFWLQEDLTYELHKTIMEAAEVDYSDVQVELVAKHGCEMHRGVKNKDCEFKTTEGVKL